MPGIDQILSIVSQQGADELRLAVNEEPQVFAGGVRKRFSMSATPEPVLRHLLGELLSQDREVELQTTGNVRFHYDTDNRGRYHVEVRLRDDRGLEVTFATRSAEHHSLAKAAVTGIDAGPPATEATEATPLAAPIEPGVTKIGTRELERLVARAMDARASDIHIADGEAAYFRIDGQLQKVAGSPELAVESLFSLGEVMQQRLREGLAVEFSVDPRPQQRLRVTVFRTSRGLAAAIRIFVAQAPTLKSLNLPLSLESLAQLAHGLVLVCGSTGAGKSSTLAALARQALESRSMALVTLEDPIEYQLSSGHRSIVRQRQLGRDVRDFASGLREALRSDPDLILVGELRDAETIRLALTAAETGHLVLASLHSGSASSCVERIIDAYPNEQRSQVRIQLADALRAVVVQKLLSCARGSGRVPALEVLRVNHAAANVIREGKTAQLGSIIQAGGRDGMLSLERCLADFVQSGSISAATARDAANDQDSLSMYLGK